MGAAWGNGWEVREWVKGGMGRETQMGEGPEEWVLSGGEMKEGWWLSTVGTRWRWDAVFAEKMILLTALTVGFHHNITELKIVFNFFKFPCC